MTTRMPEHFFKNFYVKCSELFWKLKKKWSIIENWKLKWLGGVGWVLGVILCCPFLRVGARGYIVLSIPKGRGYGVKTGWKIL